MKLTFLFVFIPFGLLGQSDIIIRHINVVNVQTGSVTENQLVFIKDNRINLIEKDNNQNFKNKGVTINGTQKYLIPGLWDMHV